MTGVDETKMTLELKPFLHTFTVTLITSCSTITPPFLSYAYAVLFIYAFSFIIDDKQITRIITFSFISNN